MPDIAIPATDGSMVNPRTLNGLAVYIVYPYTGRPGVPDPPMWDDIPGAHGSTPQLCAYSKRYDDFRTLRTRVFGLSFQDNVWQREFVDRNALRFALLSDQQRQWSTHLSLLTFKAGAQEFLRRRTLVVSDGKIVFVRDVIDEPHTDADHLLAWLGVNAG